MEGIVESPLRIGFVITFLDIFLDDIGLQIGHCLAVDAVNGTFDGRHLDEIVRVILFALGENGDVHLQIREEFLRMVVEHHQSHVSGVDSLTGSSQEFHGFKDISERFRFYLLSKLAASFDQEIPDQLF